MSEFTRFYLISILCDLFSKLWFVKLFLMAAESVVVCLLLFCFAFLLFFLFFFFFCWFGFGFWGMCVCFSIEVFDYRLLSYVCYFVFLLASDNTTRRHLIAVWCLSLRFFNISRLLH